MRDFTPDVITNLISGVGFPIVCVLVLWQYVRNTMVKFTETINENNRLLAILCEKIEHMDK